MADEAISLVVGPENGTINLEPDPKQKWWKRALTGGPQRFGLLALFTMTLITYWYFSTYGFAGLLKDPGGKMFQFNWWSTSSQDNPPSPTSFTITHTAWSATTTLSGSRWRLRTEPVSADTEVRNADTGETLVIDRDGIAPPAHWTKIHCRLPDKDPTQSALLIIW